MTDTQARRGLRVPDLPLVVPIAGALVVIGVAWVTGGALLLAMPGAVVVAAVLLWRDKRHGPFTATDTTPIPDPGADWPRTDIINMSAIRVAGAGGLGLVAMAGAVALGVPEIGKSMLVALLGGAVSAAIVIRHRRQKGPFSSIDTDPRHHTIA